MTDHIIKGRTPSGNATEDDPNKVPIQSKPKNPVNPANPDNPTKARQTKLGNFKDGASQTKEESQTKEGSQTKGGDEKPKVSPYKVDTPISTQTDLEGNALQTQFGQKPPTAPEFKDMNEVSEDGPKLPGEVSEQGQKDVDEGKQKTLEQAGADAEVREQARAHQAAEQAKKQAQEDWAKAIGMNTVNGIAGIGGGIVQGADKAMGMLIGLTQGVMSGDALGFGADVGNAVMETGMALQPIKNSIAHSLGINETNGTIDPEAAGTLQGTQYYVQQRKIQDFHRNTDKWIQDALGPEANAGNVMQIMNELPDDKIHDFVDRFTEKVDAEKDRLYEKASKGQLDAVDQALLDTYTQLGDKIRQSTYLRAREHHLRGAELNSEAQQMRLENAMQEQEFKNKVADIRDAIHASGDKRQMALFDIMERNIMTNRHDPYRNKDLVMYNPDTGRYSINEDKLNLNDWRRLANSLDANLRDPDNMDPAITDLLKEAHRMSYEANAFKAKERRRSARYREGVDDPGNSLIDRKQAEARANGRYEGVDGVNGFSIPKNVTTRDNWAGECDRDIMAIQNSMGGMPIEELLETGDPDTVDYQKAAMAYHTRIALRFTDLHDKLVRKFQLDNSEEAQRDIRALKEAYSKAMMGEYDDIGGVVWPGYILSKNDLDDGMFFSGVYPGSPQQEYITIYNNIVGKHNNALPKPKDPNQKPAGSWEYIDDGTDTTKGGISPDEIFGKNIPPRSSLETIDDSTEDLDAILSDDEPIVATAKSARIDAEGLTREELYPILKAKMGMEQEQADDFISDNMENVGVIDDKDQLNDAMAQAYSFRQKKPQTERKPVENWGDIKPQIPKGYETPNFAPEKDPEQKKRDAIYGRTTSEVNRGRKLTMEYKKLLEGAYSSGEYNPTPEQKEQMEFLRDEYKGLTGKDIDETFRGRTPEQIELHSIYNKDRKALAKEEEMRDNVNTNLGRLFGYDDWTQDQYKGRARAMEQLLARGVDLDAARGDELYGRNRAKVQGIKGDNPNDKELMTGLDEIWNAYIADYLRNRYINDDEGLYTPFVNHNRKLPMTEDERQQMFDTVQGRIARGGWGTSGIETKGYLKQVRDEMDAYMDEHRRRMLADRNLNDFLTGLTDTRIGSSAPFKADDLLKMDSKARKKTLSAIFKEFDVGELRRFRRDVLPALKKDTLDMAIYNKDFYGDENEPRFQESYRRAEEMTSLYNDLNTALVSAITNKTAKTETPPVREVTDPNPSEFRKLSSYAWVVSNFGLGRGDLAEEAARAYAQENVFPFIRAVLKGEFTNDLYPRFGNLKLRNYYAYFSELRNRLKGVDSKTEGYESFAPLKKHKRVIEHIFRKLDEEVQRRGGIDALNREIAKKQAV